MPAPGEYWSNELEAELKRLKDKFAAFNSDARWIDAATHHDKWFPIERSIVICSLYCRKLVELKLCSKNLRFTKFDVSSCRNREGRGFSIDPVKYREFGEVVENGSVYSVATPDDMVNGKWILERFDADNPTSIKVKPFKYFSRIVHCSYLVPIQNQSDHVRAVAISSPREQHEEIWIIPTKKLIASFREFAGTSTKGLE